MMNKIEAIGNKAYRLLEMRKAGFNVMPCYCIDTNTTAEIIKKQTVREITIQEVVKTLGEQAHGYSVRSSAFGEDGKLSWAGQFKSLLFVAKENLTSAILDCANQQNSETVLAYADTFKNEIPKLALVVQPMVNAKYSGVAFAYNPVGNGREAVIEGVEGIGESLVSGSQEPSRYYYEPESDELLRIEMNTEKLVLNPDYNYAILEQLQALSRFFGKPQDVEWAIDQQGTLFITQSRDITTRDNTDIFNIRYNVISALQKRLAEEGKRIDYPFDVLSDQNIAEILTTHPCQMTFGLFNYIFAQGESAIKLGRNELGYDIGDELDKGFQTLVAGQPRCSIVHDALTYRIKGMPLGDYYKIVDFYLERIREDQTLANYPEIMLYEQNPTLDFLKRFYAQDKAEKYHQTYQAFFQQFQAQEKEYDIYCREIFIPEWQKKIKALRADLEKADSLPALISLFRTILDSLRTEACKVFVKGTRIGFFAFARLRKLLSRLYGEKGEEYLNILSAGIPIELNVNLQFSISLAKLRDGAIDIKDVINDFGHLGVHELEISYPRYRNQPEALYDLAQQISGDPQNDYQKRFDASQGLQQQLLNEIRYEYEELLRREIASARRYLPLREVLKFEYLRGYDLLHEIAIQIEEYLHWPKQLIFNLDTQEIFKLFGNDCKLYHLAKDRLAKKAKESAIYVPPVIFSDNLESVGEASESVGNILKGIGATNYITQGEVVVVDGPNDKEAISKLSPGMIVVAKTTDPAWVPVLSIVTAKGGLITDVGGILAHGAIYARELGMAAILNVPQATKKLKTGMRVRINGPMNYVEIL